jgi:hypothetical protein
MNLAERFKVNHFLLLKTTWHQFLISGEANKKIFDFRQFSKFFDYFPVGRRPKRGL